MPDPRRDAVPVGEPAGQDHRPVLRAPTHPASCPLPSQDRLLATRRQPHPGLPGAVLGSGLERRARVIRWRGWVSRRTSIARLWAAVGHQLLLLPSVSVLPVDQTGQLLLVRHAGHQDGWGVPGAVEIGESPAEAAVREAREEIGAKVQLARLLNVLGGPDYEVTYPNRDRTAYVTAVHEAEIIGGVPVRTATNSATWPGSLWKNSQALPPADSPRASYAPHDMSNHHTVRRFSSAPRGGKPTPPVLGTVRAWPGRRGEFRLRP